METQLLLATGETWNNGRANTSNEARVDIEPKEFKMRGHSLRLWFTIQNNQWDSRWETIRWGYGFKSKHQKASPDNTASIFYSKFHYHNKKFKNNRIILMGLAKLNTVS